MNSKYDGRKALKNQAGFTLLELAVVIVAVIVLFIVLGSINKWF